jgi:hypothetical protein
MSREEEGNRAEKVEYRGAEQVVLQELHIAGFQTFLFLSPVSGR